MQRNEIGPQFYTTDKNNLKWIKDLNGSPETIKLLEENIWKRILDNGLSNNFLANTPKAQVGKDNKQVRLHQTNELLHRKENNKLKRQPTEWENIFANYMPDKGLISKI